MSAPRGDQDRSPLTTERRFRLGYLEDKKGTPNLLGVRIRCEGDAATWHLARGWTSAIDRVVRWPDDPSESASSWPLVVADYLGVDYLFSFVVDDEGGERVIEPGLVESLVIEWAISR